MTWSRAIRAACVGAALLAGAPGCTSAQRRDTARGDTAAVVRELRTLEQRWNEAHVAGDTAALDRLWADDITVTVPQMPAMGKVDLMAFWRTGRSKVLRYETSDLNIKTSRDAAVVEGVLRRQRDFNGRVVEDGWRFTKTYFKQGGAWRVVSYHASALPASR